MYRILKNHFFIFSAVAIFMALIFLPKLFLSAQGPAFEVYGGSGGCNNTNAYPLVDDVSVEVLESDDEQCIAIATNKCVVITAHICDVSGVILAKADVEDPNSVFPSPPHNFMSLQGQGIMTHQGSDYYQAIIDVSDNTSVNPSAPWDYYALYDVDITVIDSLYNKNTDAYGNFIDDFNPVGIFSISGITPTSITDFEVDPSSVSPGETINLSAVLVEEESGSPIAGATLYFEDITGDNEIGEAETNGDGLAGIDYPIILSTYPGIRTLRVSYDGPGDPITEIQIEVTNLVTTPAELWTDNWTNKNSEYINVPSQYVHAYNTYRLEARDQFIILASDLAYAGLQSGDAVAGIQLFSDIVTNEEYLYDFRIRMRQTTDSIVTSWMGGFTTFFGPTDVERTYLLPNDSWKGFFFGSTVGYHWDGLSNIMVDLARREDDTGGTGRMRWWNSIGSNRTFAGGRTLQASDPIYDEDSGTLFGGTFTSVPFLKVDYERLFDDGNETQIDFTVPGSANANHTITLTAVLTSGGQPVENAKIFFQDLTENIKIGETVTNANGIAQFDYKIDIKATLGDHEIKAVYVGDVSSDLLASEQVEIIDVLPPIQTTVQLWPGYPQSRNTPYKSWHLYNPSYKEIRNQCVILASDLSSVGLQAEDAIIGIGLKSGEAMDMAMPGIYDFRIRMKQTLDSITTSWEGGFTTYFGPAFVSKLELEVDGWKEYAFSGDVLYWDGTSNIKIDFAKTYGTQWLNYGSMWWTNNLDNNRGFSGRTNEQYTIYNAGSGTISGSLFSGCPAMQIIHASSE